MRKLRLRTNAPPETDGEWNAECILDAWLPSDQPQQMHYLVQWEGYASSWEVYRTSGEVGDPISTWEPEVNLANSIALARWKKRATTP